MACGTSNGLSTTSANFSGIPAGAVVRVGSTFSTYTYSIISSVPDSQHLCLQEALTAGSSQTFAVLNETYAEPHRYLANGGDLYYSTNSLFILHDSAGARYNVSAATPNFQILNQTYDPGTSPPPGYSANISKTWFNEFLTPFPNFITTPSPLPIASTQPIGRSIFMSDRAATSELSLIPEYSDHYMCGPPNCQIPVRMTEYNNADGSRGADSDCTSCTVIVATRGAWAPSGTQYLTLNQYIESSSYAFLHLYNLQYPQSEIGGHVVLSGHTKIY